MTPDRSGRRGGFTMIEVAASAFLLAAAMTLTVQVLGWVAAERRAADRRQCALQEVGNLMEHLAARPWDGLSPESVEDVAIGDEARRRLPGAELSVTVDESRGPDAKRIALRLRWRNRAGTWEAPVRLAAWVYRRRAAR
jgi:Tfp pilus assembly protein PilV